MGTSIDDNTVYLEAVDRRARQTVRDAAYDLLGRAYELKAALQVYKVDVVAYALVWSVVYGLRAIIASLNQLEYARSSEVRNALAELKSVEAERVLPCS